MAFLLVIDYDVRCEEEESINLESSPISKL